MGIRAACIALVLGCASVAAAQAEQDAGPAPATPASDASTSEASDEAAPESAEPMPETPPGYEAHAVPTPPARPTSAAPRRTTVGAHQASDDERAPSGVATASGPTASEPNVELALTLNGLLSFSGSTTPILVANADLVFAADPRVWLGLGIAFSYNESRSPAGFGVPEMKFVTSSVAVPLIFQYYFDMPHVGGAIPTLRVQLTPGWSETPVGSPTPSTQAATGSATILGGITWMAASWFALRVIGGVNGGFTANVVGPVNITGNIGVIAQISAVARF